MKYVNADIIFPEELLIEIQKYIQGGMVYVPKPKGMHKKWGENSGSREILNVRNDEIRQSFFGGNTIEQLSDQFCLSIDSIKKIVYSKKIV
ncbi:CD3324 family protein [Paenibacillus sp. FSL W7-1287]|uniref:CD3324 family protein n=1 Tax=Paenibacillus sp. FSL W7-1287 TaxID=2954538 RepID=UPI0030F529BA